MKKDDLKELLNELGINEKELCSIALETGFIKRIRKIDSFDFLHILVSEASNDTISYNDVASSMEICHGTNISRQAISKKVTENCVNFFKLILALIILAKAGKSLDRSKLPQCKFKRILIQDSTLIKLPKRLYNLFFGVSYGSGTVCNARIQGILDLITGTFVSFTINPYSINDQNSAIEMGISKNDLSLRDRGYFTFHEIRRHVSSGAHCIYRHKANLQLLDYETKEPIDLLALLKVKGSVDMMVRLNDAEKTAVRLLAQPVDQETADNRRANAKKMKGHKPGRLLLQLQSWTIFITTIHAEDAAFEQILSLYGLRWKVETIFKCWKSNLNFTAIHNVSGNQLTIILIARMIMFLIITQLIFMPFNRFIYKHRNRHISILKLTRYLIKHQEIIRESFNELSNTTRHNPVLDAIARYCVYDKRKRINFEQKLTAIFT